MKRIVLFSVVLSACSDPSTPPDAGGDADVGVPDAEADGDDGDGDVTRPDAEPIVCGEPAEAVEISPAPDNATSSRLAVGAGGFGVVWLRGGGSLVDIMVTTFDGAGAPETPVVVASARPHAASVDLQWFDGAWSVVWHEADDEASCEVGGPCLRSLRLARVSDDGAVLMEAEALWPDIRVVARPTLVGTSDHLWVVVTAEETAAQRILAGRVDRSGAEVGDPVEVFPDIMARDTPPAATLIDRLIAVIAAVTPGGLAVVTISPSTGEIVSGPDRVVAELSASEPTVVSSTTTVGLVYLANVEDRSTAAVFFLELNTDLQVPYPPIEVSRGHTPHAPQLTAVGQGWAVVWYDGRNDRDADCVTFGFCRDDVFLSSVSIDGTVGGPTRLSVDPNDCESPSVALLRGAVGVAWQTFRDERRTSFFTTVPCQ